MGTTRSARLCGVVLLLMACESGAPLGAVCTRATDCASPLVCRLERCRVECVAARDCPAAEVCLIDADGLGACELPAVDVCSLSCDPPLVCAAGHCRVECTIDGDCPDGHACVSGACQRRDPGTDAGVAGDASDPDASFPPWPDAAVDAGWTCNPLDGTGCTSGRRCGLVGGIAGCVGPSATTVGLGRPCASEGDCDVGLSCQGARCVEICPLGIERACGLDRACTPSSVHGQDPMQESNGLGLCSEICDLVDDLGCPSDGSCAIGTDRFGHDFTWCRDIDAMRMPEGGYCDLEQDCLAGLGCYLHACREYCDRMTHDGCSVGTCAASHADDISTFSLLPQVNPCLP